MSSAFFSCRFRINCVESLVIIFKRPPPPGGGALWEECFAYAQARNSKFSSILEPDQARLRARLRAETEIGAA